MAKYKHDLQFTAGGRTYNFSFITTRSTALASISDFEDQNNFIKGAMGVYTSDDSHYTGFYVFNCLSGTLAVSNGLASHTIESITSLTVVSDTITNI